MTSGLQAHAISEEILRQHRGNQLPLFTILILSSSSRAPSFIQELKRANIKGKLLNYNQMAG